MRILFCLGGLEKGGAERVASNLCNFFVSKNHQVRILLTRLDNMGYELDDKIKIRSLEKSLNKENLIIRNYKLIKKMKREIYEYKPDIIISFLVDPTIRVLFLKKYNRKIRKIPVVISERNDPKVKYKNFPYNFLVKLLYNASNGYVFQTDEAKSFFNKKIQSRSVIIPNPINDTFLVDSYSKNRKKRIVSVGRLNKQKNYKLLIDAFEIVNKKFPEYKLDIYGEGDLEDELKNIISSKKLQKAIFLKGVTNNIKKEIYDAYMYVISSDYEGMSNSLMEAMALGLPCISTDSSGGGARYLIDNSKNGLLVPTKDINKLADAMIKLIEDREYAEKLGHEANKKMKSFNQNNINTKWLNYITKIEKGE